MRRAAIGDVAFRASDRLAPLVEGRDGGDAACGGPGHRLGQPEGPELRAAGEGRQEALPLLWRAEGDERRAAERDVRFDGDRDPGVGTG